MLDLSNMENWLDSRPHWEQQVWFFIIKEGKLDDKKIEEVYKLLMEDFVSGKKHERTPINFKSVSKTNISEEHDQVVYLKDVINLKHVNALPSDQKLAFGKNLTLIYGENGSGKSGYSRLLSSACFSRGDKSILPNLRETKTTKSTKASADFRVTIGEEQKIINYKEDEKYDILKRFSVFDSSSVQIHINSTSNLTITPVQLKVFEYVIEAFNDLEKKLDNEKTLRRTQNPTVSRFDNESVISKFCSELDHKVSIEEINQWNYTASDVERTAVIQEELQKLRKLDVETKKKQLSLEVKEIEELVEKLENINSILNLEYITSSITYINEFNQKTDLSKKMGESSFRDEVFLTTGSEEWKSLISAAKILLDNEKKLNPKFALTKCPLCKQGLRNEELSLFERYWYFLEGKSLTELKIAKENLEKHKKLLEKIEFPKFDIDSPGARIVREMDEEYFNHLKEQIENSFVINEKIKEKTERLEVNDYPRIAPLFMEKLNTMISEIKKQIEALGNPELEIKKLEDELNLITHCKIYSQIKEEVIAYVKNQSWLKSCEGITFPRRQITTKQRELFDQIVTEEYRRKFAEESEALDCNFGVSITTRGASGSTVKELRLNISAEHKMGKILSEGEQRVCALADFLTEISLDKRNSGIIFDDPVTSLDHVRKRQIARRLVIEASRRQVIILTHDKVFLSYLADISSELDTSYEAHWIQRVGNRPGKISSNSSPKLATLAVITQEVDRLIVEAGLLDDQHQHQQQKLIDSFSLLRSGCEALIEQVLFNKTIQRHDDYIRVSNLNEVPWNDMNAGKIVDMHGQLSRFIDAHNRSDTMREEPITIEIVKSYRKKFYEIRGELNAIKKTKKSELEKQKSNSPW
ncbi:AAA family ATPase [Cohnella herbarum]|uniref:AAA family ATPase n=1 Tax=Cohnella herbarum TaxID=2728023 RepID=A0A7Z2VN49_9BACL|nr:AAA family ATPase [Cohnella herbarum]QJD86343.1 AAA family ATPase [Cohnella herbarum]